MGFITDPHPSEVIAEAKDWKERSLHNPDGVQYFDHLAALVLKESDLQVVLRTDEEIFDDVPVRAWWSYGRYDWQKEDSPMKSELIFEVPDEVTRRIQSKHARAVMRRFFGLNSEVELHEPLLSGNTDENRTPHTYRGVDNIEMITNDWSKLKEAIEMTSKDKACRLSGQSIVLESTDGKGYGLGRVMDGQLQIYITPTTVKDLVKWWSYAFKKEISY